MAKEKQKRDPEHKHSQKQDIDSNFYPSACLLLEHCFQDYQRLQESYNKIYDKINFALAFVGILLTIMLGAFDFSSAKLQVGEMQIWRLILTVFEMLCSFGSLLLMILAAIYLLVLLKGKKIAVFKSEDIRNEEIYRNKEPNAAMWLIDKYTKIVNDVRLVIQDKQHSFDRVIVVVIVGIIMFAVSSILKKGGF